MSKKVVVLTSGGIDSCGLNAYLMRENWEIYPIFFDYGHRGSGIEAASARLFLKMMNSKMIVDLLEIKVENPALQIPMTGHGKMPLITDKDFQETKHLDWVPHRNLIFLTLAAQYASIIGTSVLAIGSHREELFPHPDSARPFLNQMETTLTMSDGGKQPWRILTPFVDHGWYKWDVVRWMHYSLGSTPLAYTYTCYQGRPEHCGVCRGCYDRKTAFRRAHVPDPTRYEKPGFFGVIVE